MTVRDSPPGYLINPRKKIFEGIGSYFYLRDICMTISFSRCSGCKQEAVKTGKRVRPVHVSLLIESLCAPCRLKPKGKV